MFAIGNIYSKVLCMNTSVFKHAVICEIYDCSISCMKQLSYPVTEKNNKMTTFRENKVADTLRHAVSETFCIFKIIGLRKGIELTQHN